MMGYWGTRGMMNWGDGLGFIGFLGVFFWIIILIDLILLGFWLWKQINKK